MAYYKDSDPTVSLEGAKMEEQQMEADTATGNNLNLQGENKMNREEFWKLIDSTLDAEDQYDQLDLLRAELRKLNETEIIYFCNNLGELLDESHNCYLCGAAKLIKGFCNLGRFDQFRAWLISKGQYVYENALKNPDSLAAVITTRDIDDGVEFEGLLYIAQEVYEEKAGEDLWRVNNRSSELEDDIDHETENDMLNEDDLSEKHFQKMEEGWEVFETIYEMHMRYPNLMSCFLGFCH